MFFLHQSQEFALAEQCVSQAKTIKLHLLGWENSKLLDKPVIEGPMIFKLQGADRMRHVFDGIRLPMRVVVHGIDAPLIASTVMLGAQDPVHDRVTHVQIRRRHVDLRA